jgi:hypothetical protein
MLILMPVIVMSVTALALAVLRLVQPKFKYPWILAAGGAILSLASVFLWQIHFPSSVSLPSWQLAPAFFYVPTWLADEISWPYALALAALATAIIWTSVVRAETKSMPWVGILILTALGILAVAAENPITLILTWSAIDLFELITMLRSSPAEQQNEGVILGFATRLAGTLMLIWANLVSVNTGTLLDFRSIPPSAGIYLLIAAGLRLGVFPLHLPYQQGNLIRRGIGTALRLVMAAASLALLARIPSSALKSALLPYLLILAAITAIYAGWMWLRSSDEILGRPFWILGLASLVVAESLLGNSKGSVGWGAALILCGGFIFLFSARRRRILWLSFIGLWAFSTLPFSLNASSWQTGYTVSRLFIIPFLPAQALFMAGFLRHAIHPGETSLESQEKWVKVIYPTGLAILMAVALLLGFWGWVGARVIGLWWLAILVILLAVGFSFLSLRILVRLPPENISDQWTRIFRIEWLYRILVVLYNFLRRIADTITAAFEGEGGLLWSFLLLILILSLLFTRGR